jgi:CMP-N,N'-diacetyllegionaminic acid synthase
MLKGKKILAVIPARGGSKRIPKKNIVDLGGKPLLAHTIELAKQVRELDALVVSSDNAEILAVARTYGAEVLKRPKEFARDTTQDEPVLIHALETLEKGGRKFDYVVMLQCTQPFRTVKTVREVIKTGVQGNFDVVSTVVEDRSKYRRHRNGKWVEDVPGASRRSQEREPYFREADVCYMIKAKTLRETGKIFSGKYDFIIVNEVENMDINGPYDLELARAMITILKK